MTPEGVKTSGGRVLAVTACTEGDLNTAVKKAYECVSKIEFDGVQFRKDIGRKGLAHNQQNGCSYKDSGVDIDEGDSFVAAIKPVVKATARPGKEKGFCKKSFFKGPIRILVALVDCLI